jgi:hypothetical protein
MYYYGYTLDAESAELSKLFIIDVIEIRYNFFVINTNKPQGIQYILKYLPTSKYQIEIK